MSWRTIFSGYGFKSLYYDTLYRLDWRKPSESSVKAFLIKQVARSRELKEEGKLPKFTGTQDEKVLKCLKWVHNNMIYEPDKVRFQVAEKWQTIDETLNFKRGDCEDGGILIYCLARVNGVSPGQINLVCGDVDGGGHCWVEYFTDEFYNNRDIFNRDDWNTIDWCYWYDDSTFARRKPKDKTKYLSSWFEITDFNLD